MNLPIIIVNIFGVVHSVNSGDCNMTIVKQNTPIDIIAALKRRMFTAK